MSRSALARRRHERQANKLSRTYASVLRLSTGIVATGSKKVTVEHVHIHEDEQAIVGNVQAFSRNDVVVSICSVPTTLGTYTVSESDRLRAYAASCLAAARSMSLAADAARLKEMAAEALKKAERLEDAAHRQPSGQVPMQHQQQPQSKKDQAD